MTEQKTMIPTVSVTYSRNATSALANEKRGEQY